MEKNDWKYYLKKLAYDFWNEMINPFSKSPQKAEVKPLETNNLEYDPTFIYKVEDVKTVGYVPANYGEYCDDSGKTIACGLDLGQQTESSLEKMGINRNSSLFKRFRRFLGKKYKTNPEIVKMPLEITADECKFIFQSVIAWYYCHVQKKEIGHCKYDSKLAYDSFDEMRNPFSKSPQKAEVKPLETNNLEYDPTFIYQSEGVKTVGYVPCDCGKFFEHSGKTIACGLDLGQQTESSIEKMGINRNSSLFKRFQPFLGKKYETNPEIVEMQLEITADECKFICKSVIAWYYYCLTLFLLIF